MERHLGVAGATLDFEQPTSEELPDTFPRGRRCTASGCITVLSIYNAGPECHAHEPERDLSLAELMRQAA